MRHINKALQEEKRPLEGPLLMEAVQRNFGGRPTEMKAVLYTFFASLGTFRHQQLSSMASCNVCVVHIYVTSTLYMSVSLCVCVCVIAGKEKFIDIEGDTCVRTHPCIHVHA